MELLNENSRSIAPKLDFNNQFKVRINNPDPSFSKHEIVKLLIVKNLMNKYKNKINHQLIYTEYKLQGKTPDVYHYNALTKEIICYECQTVISKKWFWETQSAYDNLNNNRENIKVNWVLVDLNELSDDIKEIESKVKELLV